MKYFKYLIILIVAVGAALGGYFFTRGNLVKEPQIQGSETNSTAVAPTVRPAPAYPTTIGNFLVTDEEICDNEGKPQVYFFGSSSCPHCVWEKPVVRKVADNFKGLIDYHENFDNREDEEVFSRYGEINPGYVPFLIFGCKYVRVGAGENLGATEAESKKLEEEALTAILCKLTKSKPTSICSSLQDKIAQIE